MLQSFSQLAPQVLRLEEIELRKPSAHSAQIRETLSGFIYLNSAASHMQTFANTLKIYISTLWI